MNNVDITFVRNFLNAESEIRALRSELVKTMDSLLQARKVIADLKQKSYYNDTKIYILEQRTHSTDLILQEKNQIIAELRQKLLEIESMQK